VRQLRTQNPSNKKFSDAEVHAARLRKVTPSQHVRLEAHGSGRSQGGAPVPGLSFGQGRFHLINLKVRIRSNSRINMHQRIGSRV